MEVVLRPVNDAFLREVVFPALELGVVEIAPAIEHMLRFVKDEETRGQLELTHDQSGSSSFFGLTDERWIQASYALLFHEWVRTPQGWVRQQAYAGFAGPWEDTFHLSLMLEDPDYPYQDEERADLYRRAFWERPKRQFGLSTLLVGAWDPVPNFPPDQVLTVEGAGVYNPQAGVARADWSWRPMLTVSQWAARLPNALMRVLDRENKRLAPIVAPERHEVLDFWLGRVAEPPMLAVVFSGLGPRAGEWIREIGALAHLIRNAAAHAQGLTAVLTRPGRTVDVLVDGQ